MNSRDFATSFCVALVVAWLAIPVSAHAQVPRDIEDGLRKIGQIVDPACTARLYRPLMPKSDFNTYWPLGAPAPVSTAQLYPGIVVARDQSFGPESKDVIDIFTAEKPGRNRAVFIYVPGGGGNKIEQQVRESNAFYDNIGRWAVKNGMVGVTVQRHPGAAWDDGGRNLSLAVDWVRANIAKYGGGANRIFIAAHSAGTGPLGVYVGHSRPLEKWGWREGRDLHVGKSGAKPWRAGRRRAWRWCTGESSAGRRVWQRGWPCIERRSGRGPERANGSGSRWWSRRSRGSVTHP